MCAAPRRADLIRENPAAGGRALLGMEGGLWRLARIGVSHDGLLAHEVSSNFDVTYERVCFALEFWRRIQPWRVPLNGRARRAFSAV